MLVGAVLPKLDDHFLPYTACFESATRSVAESAKNYLRGLYRSSRANMEHMADVVAGSRYQRLHHMLSESSWDRTGVLRQRVADANACFGRGGTALVVDESGFAKKGVHSADAARCEAAHIPETARQFRTKGEIALEMIMRARRNGLLFDWVAFDGGYGHLPLFKRENRKSSISTIGTLPRLPFGIIVV